MAGRRRKNETVWVRTVANAAMLIRVAKGQVPAPRHAVPAFAAPDLGKLANLTREMDRAGRADAR